MLLFLICGVRTERLAFSCRACQQRSSRATFGRIITFAIRQTAWTLPFSTTLAVSPMMPCLSWRRIATFCHLKSSSYFVRAAIPPFSSCSIARSPRQAISFPNHPTDHQWSDGSWPSSYLGLITSLMARYSIKCVNCYLDVCNHWHSKNNNFADTDGGVQQYRSAHRNGKGSCVTDTSPTDCWHLFPSFTDGALAKNDWQCLNRFTWITEHGHYWRASLYPLH